MRADAAYKFQRCRPKKRRSCVFCERNQDGVRLTWLFIQNDQTARTKLEKRIADRFIRSLARYISNGSLAPFGNPPFGFPSYASPYIELHGTRAQLIRKTFDPFPSRSSLQPLIPRIKPLTVAIKWRERSLRLFRAPRCIVASSRCESYSPWSANPDACWAIPDLDVKSRRRSFFSEFTAPRLVHQQFYFAFCQNVNVGSFDCS
jgi:hypothetical protein